MNARLTAALAIVVFVGFLGLGLIKVAHTSAQTPLAGAAADYIIVLRDNVPSIDGEVDRIERLQNFRARLRFRSALNGFAARLTPLQVQVIQRLPWVEFVSPDYQVQIADWEPVAGGDSIPPGVRRIEAASTTEVREASTVGVAVIDTGVDLGHPDLNVVDGSDCTAPGTPAQDDNGHGTHVAGTIGAENNGSGVVGVVPGTTVYAVKVLNAQGSGQWSQVICGLDWVAANAATLNIKVANMSISGGGSNDNNCGFSNNDALHRAVCEVRDAGVTIVAAAGNSNANYASAVPAAYPEVLTVTAMSDTDGVGGADGANPSCRNGEADDRYASFSNYAVAASEIAHTIAAPGVCIRSTYVTYTTSGPWWNRTTTANHTYATISGTSMAAPHVAGSVALCLGDGGTAGPCAGMTPSGVIEKMLSDAENKSDEDGYGFDGDPDNAIGGRYYGYLIANDAAPTPDFTIEASPDSNTVAPGSGTSYTVTLTSLNGYSGDVGLTVSGLPSGASGTFSPVSVSPTIGGATSTLNITTTGATPEDTYSLTITGSEGSLEHEASVTLEVALPYFVISTDPATRTVTPGSGTSYTVTVTGVNGFSAGVVLSVEGLPANATGTFTPSTVTAIPNGATSTLNISTTSATPGGSSPLTITGVSGALEDEAAVTLDVIVPDFSVSASPASRAVTQGLGTSYTVSLTSVNGFNSSAGLSISGLPANASASFSPSSVTPTAGGANSTLNISTGPSTPVGDYTLTITGTSGSLVRSTSVTLGVDEPAQGDFSMSVSPSSRTILRFFGANSTTYTVTLTAIDGYNAPVTLSITSGLASGMTANFAPISPTPTGGGVNSTMQIVVNSSTPRGSRTLTITGVGSDGTTHSVNVGLYVY